MAVDTKDGTTRTLTSSPSKSASDGQGQPSPAKRPRTGDVEAGGRARLLGLALQAGRKSVSPPLGVSSQQPLIRLPKTPQSLNRSRPLARGKQLCDSQLSTPALSSSSEPIHPSVTEGQTKDGNDAPRLDDSITSSAATTRQAVPLGRELS